MAGKKKVPELRFQGFSGEWEEKELSKLIDLQSGKDYKHLLIGDIPVYGTGGYMLSVNKALSYTADAIGIGRKGTIDKPYLLKAPFWTVDTLFYALPKQENQLSFLNCLFQKIDWKQKDESTGVPSLSKVAINSTSVYTTSIPEQSRIGSFFQQLDSRIALQQRKLSKLAAIKKAMLEKMFPKEGSTVPEIRFQGFSGKWEKKTLGEIYTERNERGNDSLQILSVSIHSGISNTELDGEILGKQVRRSEDKSLYKHVYPGDLVLNMMRAWQGAIGVTSAEGMVSPAYITAIPNKSIHPPFMDCSLRRSQIVSQMDNLSYGVTDFRKRLYWDSFIRVECYIPSVQEQSRIADFFQQLDSLIALQQQALDKLKNIKQACLAKMFV